MAMAVAVAVAEVVETRCGLKDHCAETQFQTVHDDGKSLDFGKITHLKC